MYKDFNKIVTVMNRVYGMDLSVFDPAFLENTFERRHMISGVGDPEQYYHCLVNNCVEADVFYECIETTGKDYRFRIFAADISSEALEAGAAGEYDENAVRDVKLKYLNKYFIRQRGIYHVIPRLKQHVNFSRYDLLDQSTANPPESVYGNFDIVMCSNLLFYYTPDLQKSIIRKLLASVSDKGYLVTGDIEKSAIINESEIHRISTPTSVFQNSRRRLTV